MRRALLVILLVFAAPASAHAWSAPGGQRPASATVLAVEVMARDFWAARGTASQCSQGITVWQAHDLQDAWGRGDGSTCEMWVSDALAGALELRTDMWAMVDACTAVTHEAGHALGLPHSPTGVMAGAGSVPPWSHAWAPYWCVAWAQKRIALQHRRNGVPETTIRKWARAARSSVFRVPQKGVVRG